MSNLGPMAGGNARLRVPTPPRGETIARYDTYLEAQRAVDYLSDQHFPVQFVTIVGSGLRMVERVTGRLSYPRAAGFGAATGVWFGLFVGLLLTIFSPNAGAGVYAAVFFGGVFGMLYGVISYAFTGGRRDFMSTSQIVASEYEVLCLPEQAGAARRLLLQLEGGLGHPGVQRAQATAGTVSERGFGGIPPTAAPPPSTPPSQEQVTGPTYGEMIERQKKAKLERELAERELAERERVEQELAERGERERAERESAERVASVDPPVQGKIEG